MFLSVFRLIRKFSLSLYFKSKVKFNSPKLKQKIETLKPNISQLKVSENSRLKQLKQISRNFLSASTVIGLTRIVRAETRFMKISWVLMTLASLAFGLYLTCETIKDYLEYDVFTQTKIIRATCSLMPSVTFCFYGSDTKDLASLFNKAEFRFPNRSVANLSGENFYDEGFGDCIKFNHFTNKSGNSLFTANSLLDGFHFQVDLKKTFSLVDVFLSDSYNNILDWSQFLFTSYNSKNLYIVNIEKEVEYKLEEPYNPCQNMSDITYRQTNCLAKCRNTKLAKRYNCTLRNYYSTPGYSFCKEGISGSLEFDSVCGEECPEECTSNKFTTHIDNPDGDPNLNDVLRFEIYYLDMRYTEIRQTPKMSGYSLLNEIGGALGLFVGITFLSLLEFFEFLFEIFLVFLR